MAFKSRQFLKRQEVRRSPRQIPTVPSSIEINRQDAFEFLTELRPGSVDLFISSPPYCIGKAYEKSTNTIDFVAMHERLAPLLVRALRDGGSLCWQVGHHVDSGVITPLDALVYSIFSRQKDLRLRNRVVWTFAHGVHANRRFSGRHETVLWFTKGENYTFNLDAVRVPQKYPGKRHYKGPKKGEFSGNPLGKNPSDVWEIPNVKANHVEKTDHPCQFPVALVQRLVRALTNKGELIADPFLGAGSSALAAALERRKFKGSEVKVKYVNIAKRRLLEFQRGEPKYRALEKAIHVPSANDSVAILPKHFQSTRRLEPSC